MYAAEKKNKDKNVHKRLVALIKRTEGKSRETAGQHHTSHHWNMSYDEESALLEQFKLAAESGQIVSVSEIKEAYDKALGRVTNKTQIYNVLRRHNWRKVILRSKHPKKRQVRRR